MSTGLERELRRILPIPRETLEEAARRRSPPKATRVIQRRCHTPLPRAPSTDFEYVVQEAHESKVVFGSGLPRNFDVYGKGAPHTRIVYEARRETHNYPMLGPTTYDTIPRTAFYKLFSKVTSIHGVGTGARRAKRFSEPVRDQVPGPGHYYKTKPNQNQNKVPFNSLSQGRIFFQLTNNPGPATYYKSGVPRVLWKYQFGLAPREPAPLVTTRCTNGRPLGKCFACDNELPYGKEYWRNTAEKMLLCFRCMRAEKQATAKNKHKSRFTIWQLQAFQRERDCTDFHEHEGTTAKIHLFPDSVIKKRTRLEAYLGRFFNDDGPPEDPDRDMRPADLGKRPKQKREDVDRCVNWKNRPECSNLCLDLPSVTLSATTTSPGNDLTSFDDTEPNPAENLLNTSSEQAAIKEPSLKKELDTKAESLKSVDSGF